MKLQKVELLGFKSFADRTEIAFNGSGIVAVVGPNGCGKSNISDAIHWVLGEQSPRTLRGGRMQDVIFNGTPGRKATGLAEVRLTLSDPEAAAAPIDAATASATQAGNNGHGIASRFAEASNGVITVARRLFASGESEYLLNDRPCRLRDIHELFLGTGLGPDSYAIIEQGRIGQILSAKPYERRALIEEAAGVTKFKAKRKLAWAKLESSKQNLARVNDIFEEVTRQVNSLQRQAARARRHKELREQMQTQLRTVLAGRYRQKQEQATAAALELNLLRSSAESQAVQIEQLDASLHELQQLQERQQQEMRQAAEERGALRLEAERLRGQIASESQQVVYAAQRAEEARAEQSQLATRLAGLDAERAENARLLEQLDRERAGLAEEVCEWEARLRACQQDLEEKEQRREQLREEMLRAVGEAGTLRNQVSHLEQFLQLTEAQLARAESHQSELSAAEQATAAHRVELESRLVARREERDQVARRRRELEESLRQAKAEEERYRKELEELRAELAAQRARLSSLEEILARHAYSSETIQRLFETCGQAGEAVATASGNGATNGHGRFQPVGVLADFLEVEPAYERVVEEFLREELDYVVVKDWESAQHGLRLLETEVPGRATFLLHDATPGNGGGRSEAALAVGLRSLGQCVRFTNGFAAGSAPLLPKLERCFLVEDPDTGRSLAAQHPDLYFLTPDGIWFQGALVSAGRAGHQGPLALKRELRSLARTLEDHKQVTAEMVETLSATLRQIEEQQRELQSLARQEQECEKQLVIAERDLREAAQECDRAAERLALLELEIRRLRSEVERARVQLTHDSGEIAERERRHREMEQESGALLAAIGRLKTERESAQTRESQLRGALAGLEARRQAAAEAQARLEQAVEEVVRRATELEDQCEQWAQQQTAWQEQKQRLEQQVAAAEQRTEKLAGRLWELETASTLGRQQVAEREQQLHQMRAALEETREKKNAAEVQLALLQSEIEHLKESCRNELQVELDSLAVPPTGEESQPLSLEELAQAEELYRQLKTKLENLGPINMMALEEFEQCRERHEFLSRQKQDLMDSIEDTTQAITEIDTVCHQQFTEAFEQIGAHFQRTFAQLFGGGQGMLRLMESEDSSEAGIEIIAQPPGKRLQSVLLLSGGEKALAALALLLAIFHYRPSPFCILDEVDAPLDDSNIGRFTQMVEQMSRDTQFILITHSKKTMAIAPVMYGVTMQEPGVSKIVSVRFNGAAGSASGSAASAATQTNRTTQPLAEAVA